MDANAGCVGGGSFRACMCECTYERCRAGLPARTPVCRRSCGPRHHLRGRSRLCNTDMHPHIHVARMHNARMDSFEAGAHRRAHTLNARMGAHAHRHTRARTPKALQVGPPTGNLCHSLPMLSARRDMARIGAALVVWPTSAPGLAQICDATCAHLHPDCHDGTGTLRTGAER